MSDARIAAALAAEDRQGLPCRWLASPTGTHVASNLAGSFWVASFDGDLAVLVLAGDRGAQHIELGEARARALAASLLRLADDLAAAERARGTVQ